MKIQKKIIFISSITLILLLIAISIIQNKQEKLDYPSYICKTTIKGDIQTKTQYKFYYKENTKKIIKFETTIENIARNSKGEYDLKTLVNIIKTENKQYHDKDGISIKILNNAKNIYKYKITINLNRIKDNNILNNLNSYKNLSKQLNYFKKQKIHCKQEK